MRKSNLILMIGLIILSFFFFAFQLIMHQYIDEIDRKEVVSEFVTEVRNVPYFRKISVSDGIVVFFQQDTIRELKIEASKNMMSYIKTEVRDTELIIEKAKDAKGKDTVKILVVNNQLEKLKVISNAYFETKGIISGKKIEIEFKDNSNGNLELSYDSVICKALSGSKVNIKGDSKQVDFSNE